MQSQKITIKRAKQIACEKEEKETVMFDLSWEKEERVKEIHTFEKKIACAKAESSKVSQSLVESKEKCQKGFRTTYCYHTSS